MRKFTKFGSALSVSVLVASGMAAMSTSVAAQGPGKGRSQTVLCQLLANSLANAESLPDSEFRTALIESIKARQAALGCGR